MKRLFAVLAIVTFTIACNDSSMKATTPNEDSLKMAREADSTRDAFEKMLKDSSQEINGATDSATGQMEIIKDSMK